LFLHILSRSGTLSFVEKPIIILVKLWDQLDPLPTSGTSPTPASAGATPAIRRWACYPATGIRWPTRSTPFIGKGIGTATTPERLPGGFTLFLIQFAILVFIKALKNLFTLRFAVRSVATSRSVGGLCSETGIGRGQEAKREN
jgi:hypothetical protein